MAEEEVTVVPEVVVVDNSNKRKLESTEPASGDGPIGEIRVGQEADAENESKAKRAHLDEDGHGATNGSEIEKVDNVPQEACLSAGYGLEESKDAPDSGSGELIAEGEHPIGIDKHADEAAQEPSKEETAKEDGLESVAELAPKGVDNQPEEADTETVTRKMEVPNNRAGVLIGKAGQTIRLLQYISGAKIHITRDAEADRHSTSRPVELIGTLECITKAEKLIKNVIAVADAGGSPSLVARGFSTVQAVTADQIEIQVPNEKPKTTEMEVDGSGSSEKQPKTSEMEEDESELAQREYELIWKKGYGPEGGDKFDHEAWENWMNGLDPKFLDKILKQVLVEDANRTDCKQSAAEIWESGFYPPGVTKGDKFWDELWKSYYKQIKESEGFDLDLPNFPGVYANATIKPCLLDPSSVENDVALIECSEEALKVYNHDHRTDFKLQKVVKANMKFTSWITYFITFQAKDSNDHCKVFQAKVHKRRENPKVVELVRLKHLKDSGDINA